MGKHPAIIRKQDRPNTMYKTYYIIIIIYHIIIIIIRRRKQDRPDRMVLYPVKLTVNLN